MHLLPTNGQDQYGKSKGGLLNSFVVCLSDEYTKAKRSLSESICCSFSGSNEYAKRESVLLSKHLLLVSGSDEYYKHKKDFV